MRTENLQRAQLLMQQDRFSQAEGELRLHLANDPEDGVAHALLSVCLLRQDRFDAAEQAARQAVAMSPVESFSHQVLGSVLVERRRLDEAQQAIEEALTLNPVDADLYALRGMIFLQRSRWQDALAAAELGLQFEPDNLDCISIQSQALIKLGRKDAAALAIGGALAQAPENSHLHANQGWALLHRGEPREALHHFREALRLDPENEFAQAGMVEALKARNILYRVMLSFFLWMSRLPPKVQFGVVIGGFFGMRVLRQLADSVPALAPLVLPILIVYGLFAVMTWIADPLFNLLLRIDRYGKHALSKDQRIGSTAFGITLAIALIGGALYLTMRLTGGSGLLRALGVDLLLVFGLCLIPVSAIWKCEAGWPRWAMGLYSAGLIAFGLFATIGVPIIAEFTGVDSDAASGFVFLFILGVIASQFVANGLAMVRPRR